MKAENFLRLILGVFFIAVVVVFMMSLSGCSPAKRAARKVLKAQILHPETVASMCASLYPPVDSIYERETLLPGETKYRYDTVTVNCDSLIKYVPNTVHVRIPCPPCPVRVDTFRQVRYEQVENTAMVQAQQSTITTLQARYAKAVHHGKILLLWAIIATGILIGRFVVKYLKLL